MELFSRRGGGTGLDQFVPITKLLHMTYDNIPKILNGPYSASFCLFLFFSHDKYSTINYKSIDGVIGT